MIQTVTQDKVNLAEEQIEDKKQEIDYDTREFTIEFIVSKYLEKDDDDKSELYVPEYQREFVWSYSHQSRFIESIILGLPIPLIFIAEIKETGRLEIVDGSQRIRTLAAFFKNQLRLVNLRTLDYLNGFYFRDLSPSRQRKFKNTPMRMIVLSDKADEEVRNDMFSRINTGGVDLKDMERRKGVYRGDFINFVFECADNPLLSGLCTINRYFEKRYEKAELVLRFFAFSETYPNFSFSDNQLESRGVARFLDEYVIWKNDNFTHEEKMKKLHMFQSMLFFVKKTFPSGFKKYNDSDSTSRPYFESISVGSLLAIQEKPNLVVKRLWKQNATNNQSHEFHIPIERYQTHKPENMLKRINYVKDQLLAVS
ncbi:MAG: DUF262 domain-containing protein [Microcystaceae cyanobacterium]